MDLNLLVDYNPTIFMRNISSNQKGSFVYQAAKSNPELLSLLITNLEDLDVTRTKYQNVHTIESDNFGEFGGNIGNALSLDSYG